jgi:hypothetical protein
MSKEPATPVATHHQAISTEQVGRAGQAWAFSSMWMTFDHHMTT